MPPRHRALRAPRRILGRSTQPSDRRWTHSEHAPHFELQLLLLWTRHGMPSLSAGGAVGYIVWGNVSAAAYSVRPPVHRPRAVARHTSPMCGIWTTAWQPGPGFRCSPCAMQGRWNWLPSAPRSRHTSCTQLKRKNSLLACARALLARPCWRLTVDQCTDPPCSGSIELLRPQSHLVTALQLRHQRSGCHPGPGG